jgi:hypothetical protein
VISKASFRIALFAVIAALVLAFASVPTALAAKGGGRGGTSGTSSLSLVLLNSTDGLPHYGQQVTFNVDTTATGEPYVNLKCFQNGVFVGEAWRGFFPASLTGQIFSLGGSTAWQGGAADCTAYLDKYTKRGWQQLASTSFHVYA